jgi:peptidyl-prolyl cis-trans isomerase C
MSEILTSRNTALLVAGSSAGHRHSLLRNGAILCLATILTACGSKEQAAGQAIAKVDGQEITVLQLNEELQRIGGPQTFTSKQVLDALVERQLLVNKAQEDKIDRDPVVMRAIERAKEQILAQAYLQKKIGNSIKPAKSDIDDFFQKNPELFAQRKQFELKELVVETAHVSPELNATIEKASSLDEVALWLEAKKVPFERTQVTRTSTDLPLDMVKALKGMVKGQLFTVKEGTRSLLIALHDVKEAPLSAVLATPQIEQFLINKKNKESGEAEIARLRTAAKIEYLNQSIVSKDQSGAPAATPAATTESRPANLPAANHIGRGVAGLK